MQNPDFAGASLTDFLQQLADSVADGCLHVGSGDRASQIFLRGGQIYAVLIPGERSPLTTRLVTSGALSPSTLAEVVELRQAMFPTWSIAELLVHHGHVEQARIDAVLDEQLRESITQLLTWELTDWSFRVHERTRGDLAPLLTVSDLLTDISRRRAAWGVVEQTLGGSEAVPVLASSSTAVGLGAEARTLLVHVDGIRNVAALATRCGLTRLEAGEVVVSLVETRQLTLARPAARAVTAPLPLTPTSLGLTDLSEGGSSLALFVAARRRADAQAAESAAAAEAAAAARLLRDQAAATELAEAVRAQAEQAARRAAEQVVRELAEQAAREQAAREQAEAHTAVLAEFRAAAAQNEEWAGEPRAVPVARAVPAAQAAPIEPALSVAAAPALNLRSADADTAALLRELASLGLDDDEPPSPAITARASSSRTASAGAKGTAAKASSAKRGGRFGRS